MAGRVGPPIEAPSLFDRARVWTLVLPRHTQNRFSQPFVTRLEQIHLRSWDYARYNCNVIWISSAAFYSAE